MRAIDLSSDDVVLADESTTLGEASKLMRNRAIEDIVITRGDGARRKPLGMLTDRDIVIHAVACDLVLDTITVGDLSHREVATCAPDADLNEIVAMMNKFGVRHLLVGTGDEFVGVVSLDNVIHALVDAINNLTALLARQGSYDQQHRVQTGRT